MFNINTLSAILGYKETSELNIIYRKNRDNIPGFENGGKKGLWFESGDVIAVFYEKGPVGYYFEGICLAIKKRSLIHRDTSMLLRNIINGVAVEVRLAYYYNRAYKLRFNDYKRKRFSYTSRKLFYLRFRLNRESKIKA